MLVLLILNFKPSGLLGEWELTPRHIRDTYRRLRSKINTKKEG